MLEERKALAGAGRGMLARGREAGGAQARKGDEAVSLAGQDSRGNMPRESWRESDGAEPLPRQDGRGSGAAAELAKKRKDRGVSAGEGERRR